MVLTVETPIGRALGHEQQLNLVTDNASLGGRLTHLHSLGALETAVGEHRFGPHP